MDDCSSKNKHAGSGAAAVCSINNVIENLRARPRNPRKSVFDSRAHFCHSAPMETHAFGFRLRTPDTVELDWSQRGENEPEVGAWKEGLRGGEFLAEINEHCIVGRRAQAMEPHG